MVFYLYVVDDESTCRRGLAEPAAAGSPENAVKRILMRSDQRGVEWNRRKWAAGRRYNCSPFQSPTKRTSWSASSRLTTDRRHQGRATGNLTVGRLTATSARSRRA